MNPKRQNASDPKISAFIMIVVQGSSTSAVADDISRIKVDDIMLQRVYTISGEFDFLIRLEASSLPQLTNFLSTKIMPRREVGKTITALVLPGSTSYTPLAEDPRFSTHAFIFLGIQSSLVFPVLGAAKELSTESVRILTADVVTGKYDIIMHVQGESIKHITKFVAQNIWGKVEGVLSSTACFVAGEK